jgi:hypothetical protein
VKLKTKSLHHVAAYGNQQRQQRRNLGDINASAPGQLRGGAGQQLGITPGQLLTEPTTHHEEELVAQFVF